jgi:hypothetical protein
MKLASRSAMLSLSSAKDGSSLARGKSADALDVVPLGVDWDARRLVRDGGRNGVVGREGRLLPLRVGLGAGVAIGAVFGC